MIYVNIRLNILYFEKIDLENVAKGKNKTKWIMEKETGGKGKGKSAVL